jgi:MoaA/NifB/PqqE/SkfB family radical SAM enzyme
MMNLKDFKGFLKTKLSHQQINMLRFAKETLKKPTQIKREFNTYQYNKSKLRVTEINHVPPVFCAVIVDSCNLRCPNCLFILENPNKFFNSHLTSEQFEDTLKKYNKDMTAEVMFLSGGEPLIHPEFEKLVKISRKYKMSPKVSTNGILIMNNPEALLDLDYVNVSMDSYDYDTFKKYRGGTKRQFDRILEGLNFLSENKINFGLSYVLSAENAFEIEKMIEFSERHKPTFAYFHNINPHGSNEFKPLFSHDKKSMKHLTKVLDRNDYTIDIHTTHIFNEKSPHFKEAKCIQPWYYFCFNSKGAVSVCCHMEHDDKFGNIFKNYDFNSTEMVKWRKKIMSDKIPDICLHCQRRFLDEQEFSYFDSAKKKWIVSRDGDSIIRSLQQIFIDNQANSTHIHH